ncbi:MAG: hypothetical protein Kow0098_08610 [Ignavibacteriaceae bacterium]
MFEVDLSDFQVKYIDEILYVRVNFTRATYREALDLKELLDTELALKKNQFVIDLSMCEFMDSTFIGALVVTFKKVISRNGCMVFVQPAKIFLSVLSVLGTLKHFKFFKSTQDAIDFVKNCQSIS